MVLGAYALIPDTDARLQFWREKGLPIMAPYLASPWTGIILIVIGLAWLWFFRGVIHVHHGSLTAEMNPIVSLQTEVVRAASLPNHNSPPPTKAVTWVPDWPIRNLFFRLNPNLRQDKSKADFDTLADEITNKLSTGQLLAWGRAIDGSRTLPLFPIPEDYWLHAKLNIWLLDDEAGGGNILQAAPSSLSAASKSQYREIMINQAQALIEWPKAVLPVERDTKLGDALAYIVTGAFDRKAVWENEGGAISGLGEALKQFEQAARDGKVQVWGKQENWGVFDPIPAEYWSNHSVHFLDLFREETDIEYNRSPLPHYKGLRVSRAEFEKQWPR